MKTSCNGNKVTELQNVLLVFYLEQWTTMVLFSVFSWVHGKSELQISEKHAERFDQPEQAAAWLQLCRSINGKFLTEVSVLKGNFTEILNQGANKQTNCLFY